MFSCSVVCCGRSSIVTCLTAYVHYMYTGTLCMYVPAPRETETDAGHFIDTVVALLSQTVLLILIFVMKILFK